MYINYKNLIRFLLILTVVFTTACNDNKEKIEILKIDGLWIDRVPENTISEPNATRYCNGVQNYLLLPSSVQKDSDINIKLYGCWDSETRLVNNQIFHAFKSTKKDNKITLTVLKKILNDERGGDLALDFFKLRKEYNITTNDFEVGDVKFVVKNPDGEELTTNITIE